MNRVGGAVAASEVIQQEAHAADGPSGHSLRASSRAHSKCWRIKALRVVRFTRQNRSQPRRDRSVSLRRGGARFDPRSLIYWDYWSRRTSRRREGTFPAVCRPVLDRASRARHRSSRIRRRGRLVAMFRISRAGTPPLRDCRSRRPRLRGSHALLHDPHQTRSPGILCPHGWIGRPGCGHRAPAPLLD